MLPMQRAMSLSTSSIRLPFLRKADGYHPYQRCLHRSDGRRGRTEGGPASCYGQSYHGQTAHFDVVSKRKDDVDIYKHEQESMRRSYIENYYNAMDTVIQLLDNSQTVPSWKETRYKKMLDVLKIKSTEEFDMLYTIDMSYLFFSGPYRSRAKRWMTGYRPILNGQRKRRRYCVRSNDASPSRP